MPAAKSLRSAIAWLSLAVAYVIALSFYKSAMLNDFARSNLDTLNARHQKIVNLFQASFYFFYEDQFLPGVKQALIPPPGGGAPVQRFVILGSGSGGTVPGATLFDSADPPKTPHDREKAAAFPDAELVSRLDAKTPLLFLHGFQATILMPPALSGGQYAVVYYFDGANVRNRMLAALAAGLAILLALRWLLSSGLGARGMAEAGRAWRVFWRLRIKFLAAIVAINLVTALILFFTLSSLQTREETQRIEKESVLFAQFSTAQVISNFTNFYYFYYSERFIPEMKRIIASNENLMAMRIISRRTGAVLFDSEQADYRMLPASGTAAAGGTAAEKLELAPETEELLRVRDWVAQPIERDGQRLLSVINAYRNENQEVLFAVEYIFSFHTLARSVQAIRHQILVDLVPSLALGLLIAAFFAQFLLSPIRRLVAALQRVTAGDYNLTVDVERTDEIGDLVTAFNAMTVELERKKELRKYLSDSTYRQIMTAPTSADGVKLGGTRVAATVLFSDIRNFVAHCESLDAEEVTSMLNEYFAEMVDVVHKHGGEVDKFIGDAFLAVFYASDEPRTIRPSDSAHASAAGPPSSATALQAIYCALEMRERLKEFNERRRLLKKNTLETGVGITHGEIISGPIGAKDRMDFTVIGDVVNLASRIEKLSKLGTHSKIVFSHHVEQKIHGLLDYVPLTTEKIRGKEEEVQVYELVGIRDIDVLVRNLTGTEGALKRSSIELLGQTRNPRALGHVLGMLAAPEDEVRLQAVLAAAKLAPRDDARTLDAFFGRLRDEKDEKVLSALVTAVGRVCTSIRVMELAPFLESDNERIVANAVEALGQARDPRCADLVLPKLTSRNNRIKANAAMALFASGHIEVIDTLKPMLMHSDGLMRSSAAFAIGELTLIAEQSHLIERFKSDPSRVKMFLGELQECVPMLVALLRDPEPMVKRQAVIALGKIKDKSAVLPIIDMIGERGEASDRQLVEDITQALRAIGSHKLVREVISRLN